MSALRIGITGVGLLRPLLLSLALPLLLLFAGAAVTARSGDGEGAPEHGAPESPDQGSPEGAPEEPAASPVTIRFVEPQGLIQGVTRITVEATTSAGATIVKVGIYVDGTLLSILEKPPYTLTWNAGNRFHQKITPARIHESTSTLRIRTRPPLARAKPRLMDW